MRCLLLLEGEGASVGYLYDHLIYFDLLRVFFLDRYLWLHKCIFLVSVDGWMGG